MAQDYLAGGGPRDLFARYEVVKEKVEGDAKHVPGGNYMTTSQLLAQENPSIEEWRKDLRDLHAIQMKAVEDLDVLRRSGGDKKEEVLLIQEASEAKIEKFLKLYFGKPDKMNTYITPLQGKEIANLFTTSGGKPRSPENVDMMMKYLDWTGRLVGILNDNNKYSLKKDEDDPALARAKALNRQMDLLFDSMNSMKLKAASVAPLTIPVEPTTSEPTTSEPTASSPTPSSSGEIIVVPKAKAKPKAQPKSRKAIWK